MVLILLAGRFMGKRVVFLKQLSSGLLLVSGPFKINGVPLRRVNQSYVVATSTKVDISGVNVEKLDDQYFAKEVAKKTKKGEGEFIEEKKEKSSNDPLHVPVGPITRARAKRFKEALNDLIQDTWADFELLKSKISPHEDQ
ncbi:hypothetical protein Ddye_000635 [Dipteronia dyeriana]|uniref:60S ribosomal protein L6 n=1 Tax=Dipteronia dyeriana TaxID=168575 RepID=A0AAD9XML0_9ROSI|nr:hypothetical protein Ddye_000635 [Dipteronia dyeriana]